MLKLHRIFAHDYENADLVALQENGYSILHCPKNKNLLSIFESGGFGFISGTTQRLMKNYSNANICLFDKINRKLVFETKPNKSGDYFFRNIKTNTTYFIVAFDQAEQYNAVVQDNIYSKDVRL